MPGLLTVIVWITTRHWCRIYNPNGQKMKVFQELIWPCRMVGSKFPHGLKEGAAEAHIYPQRCPTFSLWLVPPPPCHLLCRWEAVVLCVLYVLSLVCNNQWGCSVMVSNRVNAAPYDRQQDGQCNILLFIVENGIVYFQLLIMNWKKSQVKHCWFALLASKLCYWIF